MSPINVVAIVLLTVIAFFSVITVPASLLILVFIKPWLLLLWLILAYAICFGFGIRSWRETLGVLAALTAGLCVLAVAAHMAYKPWCRDFIATSTDSAKHPRQDTVDVALVDPGPPPDWRLHSLIAIDGMPEPRDSKRVPDAATRGGHAMVRTVKFWQTAQQKDKKASSPNCAVLLTIKGFSLDTGSPGATGKSYEHCLTEQQRDYLLHGLRLRVERLAGGLRSQPLIATAYDRETNEVVATVVFNMAQPQWYGFPFDAYYPIVCTTDGARWTADAGLGVLPPVPPLDKDIAVAVALKAAYARFPPSPVIPAK